MTGDFQLSPEDIRAFAEQIIRDHMADVEMLAISEFLEDKVPDDLSHKEYDRACEDVDRAIVRAIVDIVIPWP
jgi:hypothetical protein